MTTSLRAPFPYFGGKRRVASTVWAAFGHDVTNYVEPFFGSGAVLLARQWTPGQKYVETVNDADGFLCNFWRAVQAAPEKVAEHADWPVSELDLHARHRWLVGRRERVERLRREPEFYDAQMAGWWVWGISQWIGSGWCAGTLANGENPSEQRKKPRARAAGALANSAEWDGRTNAGRRARNLEGATGWRKRPVLGTGGVGRTTLTRQMPELSGDSGATGRGTHAGHVRLWEQLPALDDRAGQGVNAGHVRTDSSGLRTEGLYAWMRDLQARLRWVRICCGDFKRVLGPSVTEKIGTTAVFLDPPYGAEADRDPSLYAEEDDSAAARARTWALAHGDNPKYRIALCGYEGEHEMPESWTCIPWKASGGYAASAGNTENAHRERIWFSPHCLPVTRPRPEQRQLFNEVSHG